MKGRNGEMSMAKRARDYIRPKLKISRQRRGVPLGEKNAVWVFSYRKV